VPPSKLKRKLKKKAKRQAFSGHTKNTPANMPVKMSARRHRPAKQKAAGTLSRPPVGQLFEELVAVQARLRAPGGCPWDREQTHSSLKTYLIEEAYETLDALENGDPREFAEELGDLLLQILFHADLALEAGTFNLGDVIVGIRDKMIRRHPHVFGNVKAETSSEVLKNWAQLKAQEKKSASTASSEAKPLPPSALDGVPRNLPALLEAYQLTRRAAQVGFDWDKVEGIIEKLNEEVSELRVALQISDRHGVEEEIGDLLFVVVNLSRFLGFDPEVALKQSNLKFKSRFHLMEGQAKHNGQRLDELSNEELEVFWEDAKLRHRALSASESNT